MLKIEHGKWLAGHRLVARLDAALAQSSVTMRLWRRKFATPPADHRIEHAPRATATTAAKLARSRLLS